MTQNQIIEKTEKIRADVEATADKFNSKFSNIFTKAMTNDVIAGFSKNCETVKQVDTKQASKKEKAKSEPKADASATVDATVAISPKATDKTTVNPASFQGSFAKGGRKIHDNEDKNFVKPMPFVFTKGSNRDMSVGPQGQAVPKPNTTMPKIPLAQIPNLQYFVSEIIAQMQATRGLPSNLSEMMTIIQQNPELKGYLAEALAQIPGVAELQLDVSEVLEYMQASLKVPQLQNPQIAAAPQPVPCACENHQHTDKPVSTVNEKVLEPVTKLIEELGMTVQFLKDPDTSLIQAIITHNGAIVTPSCFTIDLYAKVINGKAKWFPTLVPANCGYEDYPCYSLDNLDYLKSHLMGNQISNGRLVNSPDYIELNKFIDLVTFPKRAVSVEVRSTIMTRLIMAMKKGAFDSRDANRWSFTDVKSEKDFTLVNNAPKRIGFPVVREPKKSINFTETEAIFA